MMRLDRTVVWTCILVLALSEVAAAESSPPACDDSRSSLVAVALAGTSAEPGLVVLATPSGSTAWRYRVVSLEIAQENPTSLDLSPSGMTAIVKADGTTWVADLTSGKEHIKKGPPAVGEPPSLRPLPSPCEGSLSILNKGARRALEDRWRTHFPVDAFPEPSVLRWAFYSVDPKDGAAFYAPVLEVVDGDAMPTRFDIWDQHPMSELRTRHFQDKEAQIEEAQRLYWDGLSPAARACTIYYHVDVSHPGVWLYQYWFYYPFDAGAFEDHVHDAEAFFVEVDKLGGSVRRVVGAAHGAWAPSNVYSTIKERSPTATLPLFAIVEFRKHAMAPDINRDGLFQPGVDTNQFLDKSKVWGIRDAIGSADANVRGFDASMPVPRRRRSALALEGFTDRFAADFDVGPEQAVCKLEPLQVQPQEPTQAKACNPQEGEPENLDKVATAECARSKVLDHDDWHVPKRILKGGAFPWLLFRVGVAMYPGADYENSRWIAPTQTTLSLGVGADVARLTFGRLVLPGRLALDVLFRNRRQYVWSSDDSSTAFATGQIEQGWGAAGASLRYERQLTPLFGTYLGASWLRDLKRPSGDVFTNPWLEWGLRFERSIGNPRLRDRFSFSASIGAAGNDYFGLQWDLRMGIGVRVRPRTAIGIRDGDGGR